MSDGVFIGIEIGGTKLQFAARAPDGFALRPVRIPVERAAGADGIRAQIEAVLNEFRDSHKIAGIGVGFGGPVDRVAGRIARSHQIDGWDDFPLAEWISQRAGGANVILENDSNAAAFAEVMLGAGEKKQSLFYCNFGSGVGGALVMRYGIMFHGAPPGEMEFGHLRLDPLGATVESMCSGWAVDARIRAECARAPRDSALARLVLLDPGHEARHLSAALKADDALAKQILDETAKHIGFALSHVVHLAHPDLIVLGGGLSLIGEPFRAAVAAALKPFVMQAFAPGPGVALASLGEDAVPIGAMQLAIRRAIGSMEHKA